jgi:hypothetical protein
VGNGQDPTEESEDIDKMMKLFGAKA